MHSSLITGSMPGMAASTRLTWLFGSPPNSVEAPENSFDVGGDLRMHLHADHHFPGTGRAFDQIALFGSFLHFNTQCVIARLDRAIQ